MQAEKLTQLATFLREKVAPADTDRVKANLPKIFNMEFWLYGDAKGHWHEHASLDCGTPGCAGGWATAIFSELSVNVDRLDIVYGEYCGYSALREFFDLDDAATLWLFSGKHRHRTAQQEADIIDEFVKSGGRVPYHAY